MNCSEFESSLAALVESHGEQLSRAMASHSSECAECGQRCRDHQLLVAAVRAWRPVSVPGFLAEAVLEELRCGERSSPRSTRGLRPSTGTRWMVVMIAAASLLLVLGLGMTGPTSPSGLAPMVAIRTSESVEVASSVAAVLQDLKSGYRELAEETTATAREFAVALPAPSSAPWTEIGLVEPVVKSVDTVDQANEHHADIPPGAITLLGRSIGSQIGQAMDFLRVAVPEDVPRG